METGMFKTDTEIFQFLKEKVYVAVVSDILDSLGYRQQAMDWRLRPILPDKKNCGLAGRARTLRWMDVDYIDSQDPYGLEIDAMDSLKPGDVVVHSSDPALSNAPWGELMTTVARRNGAVGCVCDSCIRDTTKIIDMGFPVYCVGFKPIDSQGRGMVKAYDVPIRCGGVKVNPGELVYADYDGIVVIPSAAEQNVLELALEKVGKENAARQDLIDGKTLRETYTKYGIL
jgi:4-hydroxy-4-methyl-2-oxoglutarate aldolase